ncbi:hypothetical protein BO85DRAFT_279866 [Aspergillus piperis CBS 112811]|uniref:Uncharacterized protein n=1 Tax=Aspergillus piperis CBS 112811 TaxID=1448313 RepID=A0A8G1R4U4_9EURO|nr:hypothetical protein BO85DRAFT_279866 [Aspergillus piperis CBS 112811]RAH58696.1 hypothetical protein BO85DRAFT_279866 [Aspergillus piperis CBS 112811]
MPLVSSMKGGWDHRPKRRTFPDVTPCTAILITRYDTMGYLRDINGTNTNQAIRQEQRSREIVCFSPLIWFIFAFDSSSSLLQSAGASVPANLPGPLWHLSHLPMTKAISPLNIKPTKRGKLPIYSHAYEYNIHLRVMVDQRKRGTHTRLLGASYM